MKELSDAVKDAEFVRGYDHFSAGSIVPESRKVAVTYTEEGGFGQYLVENPSKNTMVALLTLCTAHTVCREKQT